MKPKDITLRQDDADDELAARDLASLLHRYAHLRQKACRQQLKRTICGVLVVTLITGIPAILLRFFEIAEVPPSIIFMTFLPCLFGSSLALFMPFSKSTKFV